MGIADKIFTFLNVLFLFLILNTLYLILYTPNVFAQDFRNDYQVEYFLSQNQNKISSKVKFTITITNLRSDLYVKQFSMGFPKSFTIRNIRAYDDHVELTPQLTSTDQITKIALEFSNPNVGKNSLNNFFIEFYQDNLFTLNGNVWEVIIPTVEDKKNATYKIIVHLPENSDRKISISKPKPDSISGNTVVWNNPKTKTVYAVFGDVQYYQAELTYHLKNNQLVPVYSDVAFTPDTLYQKIYLDKINPNPAKVFTDEDGNLLGRYFLKPSQSMTVVFSGKMAIYSQIRDEVLPHVRKEFKKQKSYLLAESKYWKITDQNKIKNITADVKDIYYFVTNKLQYDYNKVNTSNKRLGADGALLEPNNAVCMEFTDLFVATAREKGIYAREIEGYGFSQDAKFRPLSLVSDILHSWPEYYNEKSGYWIPVDPTWENTSGIDYFSSFDLNHITFAIHGKKSDYPPPAGTYKTEDSRDVTIALTNQPPAEIKKISVGHDPFPSQINDSQIYQAKFSVKNEGNTYVWDENIPILASNLETQPKFFHIENLAPYETISLTLSYKSTEKNKRSSATLGLIFPRSKAIKSEFTIIPFYYELTIKISFGMLILVSAALLILIVRKNHDKIRTK